jgi:methylmalonyl-CoA carboxyltransferase small subunit
LKLQIAIDGKTYEVDVEVQDEGAGHMPPYMPYAPRTSVTSGAMPGAPPTAAPRAPSGDVNEDKVCRSPIAGVVIKVNVQEGQQLQENDLLLVLEAMKMETNVTAPVAGKVKSIEVGPGDAVQVNQVLVEFE